MRRHRHAVTSATALLALALAAVACGREAGGPAPGGATPTTAGRTAVPAGSVTIDFQSDPDPPQSGDNTYQVTVRQPDGTPVTDADVTAIFSMPAMPAMNMPAMRSDASLSHAGNGTYRGTGQLSMGGTWNVEVSVSRGAEPLGTSRFSVVTR